MARHHLVCRVPQSRRSTGIPPWSHTALDAPWSDYFDNLPTDWMQHQGVFTGHEIVGRAVWTVAKDRPLHRVREYRGRSLKSRSDSQRGTHARMRARFKHVLAAQKRSPKLR